MANFTPQEIENFLKEFFDVVGARQYIGARYVPIFGRKGEDSIQWDNSKPYEPLTIVLYQGNSYTSRQYVPIGVDITNVEFWAETGNYNAQIEAYRAEVLTFNDRIASLEVNASLADLIFSSAEAMRDYDEIANGQLVTTKGYYELGDGGSGFYYITDDTPYTPNDIDIINCQNNMTAILINEEYINAAAFGCVGDNVPSANIERALDVAAESNKKIIFPCELSTSTSITIVDDMNVEIWESLTYDGNDAAVVFDDCSNSTLKAKDIIATNATGIKLYQHDPNLNVNKCKIEAQYIEGNIGVHLAANTRGILQCEINVTEIKADTDCIRGDCLQSTAAAQSYIGQIIINILHGRAIAGYGAIFNATATNDSNATGVVTVICFGDTSFENSYGGIYLNGKVHDVRFASLRTVEQDSFNSIIKLVGKVEECVFNIAADIYSSMIDNQCTATMQMANKIVGALTSPSGFRMDGVIYLYNNRTVIKPDIATVAVGSGGVYPRMTQFGDSESTDSYNWRAFTRIENVGSGTLNYKLNTGKLRYFDPAGVSDIIINNHTTNSPVILTLDDVVIFDGTTKEAGRHHFLLSIYYKDASSSETRIETLQID